MTDYVSDKVKHFQKIGSQGNYTYKKLSNIVDKFLETNTESEEWPLYEAWVLAHMRETDGVYIDNFNWVLT